MITTRIRTFFVVGSVSLLLSLFTSLLVTNGSVLAAGDCNFAMNASKTKISMSCNSGSTTIPFSALLSKEGSSRVYSHSGTSCKTSVTMTSNTKGTHKTVGATLSPTSCQGFPKSQGSVTVRASTSEDPGSETQKIEEDKKACEAKGDGWDYDDSSGECVEITTENEGEKTSCALDGVGWIVCPVVTFLGKMNDLAFGFINNFLEIRPALFTDTQTRLAWEAFRNIANIAFVIAFMVIVYSQLTGAGINNYGIKRLLPKLIIAAILVNVSFWICAILVDLSNIVGASLYSLLKTDILLNQGFGAEGGGFSEELADIWSGAIAVALGATISIALIVLVLMSPMALLAFALVIFILIARQALVLMLIVLSPLAFVAYLLPNTEDWFKKWWKAFSATLMVFPIIAVVFGMSYLASTILLRISEDGTGGGDDEQMLKIIAAAVLAVPLFAVPAILKGSLSAVGTIGARITGLADKAQGAGAKAMKRQAESWEARAASNEQATRLGQLGRFAGGYRTRRGFKHASMEAETKRGQEKSLSSHVLTNPDRFSNRQRASAFSQNEKAFEEEVSAAAVLQKGMGFSERHSIATTGQLNGEKVDEAERVAAINHVMENGNFKDRQSVLQSIGGMKKRELQATSDGYYKTGMQGTFGAILGDHISQGGYTTKDPTTGAETRHNFADMTPGDIDKFMFESVLGTIKGGKVKAETLVEDGDATQYIATVAEAGARTGQLTAQELGSLKTAVAVVGTSPALAGKRTEPVQKGLDRIGRL